MSPYVEPLSLPMSDAAMTIVNVLMAEHPCCRVYLVGGAVRDFLNKYYHAERREAFRAKDEDLATDLSEAEILAALASPRAVRAGVRVKEKESVDTFGVVFASVMGSPTIEVAPFRKDVGSADGRRPERVERGTIEDDAARRDLTINSLYYDPLNRRILDYNPGGQGLKDIHEGRVRTVGDPHKRFEEDKLRVLRLVRFFSRMHRGPILPVLDKETVDAVDAFRDFRKFPGMTSERIQAEFLVGIAQSQWTADYLSNLASLCLLLGVFPGLKLTIEGVSGLNNEKSPRVVLAWLLQLHRAADMLHDLKYPKSITEPVRLLQDLMDFDPDRIADLVRRRDQYYIKAGRDASDLTPAEVEHNEQMRAQMQDDIMALIRLVRPAYAYPMEVVHRLRHFVGYDGKLESGEALVAAGFKGPAIGEEQRRRLKKDYDKSYKAYLARNDLP